MKTTHYYRYTYGILYTLAHTHAHTQTYTCIQTQARPHREEHCFICLALFCVSLELLKFYVPKFTCCTPHGIAESVGGGDQHSLLVLVQLGELGVGVTIVGQAKVLWFATGSVSVLLLLFCMFGVYASFVAFVVAVVVFVVIYAMEMRKLFGAHIYIFGRFYARPF